MTILKLDTEYKRATMAFLSSNSCPSTPKACKTCLTICASRIKPPFDSLIRSRNCMVLARKKKA